MRRKLIGINNFTERTRNFMDEETEVKLYEKVYALLVDGRTETLRETFFINNNKLKSSATTEENPYELDFDFLENGTWESYNRR